MNTDKDNSGSSAEENKSSNSASGNEHPINPFKDPAPDTNESPEEIAAEEQKLKEALTERD